MIVSPVQSLTLPKKLVCGLPPGLAPGMVPWIISFSKHLSFFLIMCPKYVTFLSQRKQKFSLWFVRNGFKTTLGNNALIDMTLCASIRKRKIMPKRPVDRRIGAVHKVRRAFLANFDPPPLSHFVTHPGTPPESTSHISDLPLIF